ncbi:Type IV secretory pathway, VirB4 components [Moraxella ovis]|uniref:Type IV secretory pathway, VirB4 components n=1 Tax=Moraxella ovis TaxID=29433 RepID=A0A378PJL9_9GAMM|nr:Type IV secretory pathway, VirB4 components [Moraxella ovis]STY86952.1 Type IV secretory pathway, VirB4 components [Moraxella ovis]STZ05150.1 Type IV secretory pathway, VirB4 components [Moraxella ovis]
MIHFNLAKPIDNATDLSLMGKMANRHGLITGATGTGKTISLRKMTEEFSRAGVPVFLADVKGDLSGIVKAGESIGKVGERMAQFGLDENYLSGFPV